MRIVTQEKLNDNLGLSIVEVDDPIVRMNFENRFQVVIEINNKKIFPREKSKFLSFNENNHIHLLKSETTNGMVLVNQILYHEKKLCDKSYEECSNIITNYLFSYLNGNDIKLQLKRLYKF